MTTQIAIKLTRTEYQQLLAYAEHANKEGWFYGNRLHFEVRHMNIMEELHRVLGTKYE